MAGQVVLTISKDEAERFRLERELKYHLDRQAALAEARLVGRAEGICVE